MEPRPSFRDDQPSGAATPEPREAARNEQRNDPRDVTPNAARDATRRAQATGTPESGAASEPATRPEERLTELEAENEELRRSWQRATADYQNLRRRLQSDIDGAVARALSGLMGDLLLVLDYLDLALAAPAATDESRALHQGVDMTRGALLAALERQGVRAVPEQGAFDPRVHEAVERVETSAVAAGQIVATLRRGYTQGGAVLRPAQVRVAAAPGAGDPGGADQDDEDGA